MYYIFRWIRMPGRFVRNRVNSLSNLSIIIFLRNHYFKQGIFKSLILNGNKSKYIERKEMWNDSIIYAITVSIHCWFHISSSFCCKFIFHSMFLFSKIGSKTAFAVSMSFNFYLPCALKRFYAVIFYEFEHHWYLRFSIYYVYIS